MTLFRVGREGGCRHHRVLLTGLTAGTEGVILAVDVLIAEDEPSILEALDFVLRRAGWTIESVTDGDAVLDAVRRLRPRVLVLDVMLPKRSGFEVLKQIRADQGVAHLPVLVLTAKGQQQDRRIAEEMGADAFITKPYSNAEVVDAVRRLLDGPVLAHGHA
jgi:two-component system, OmpR family, response regulator